MPRCLCRATLICRHLFAQGTQAWVYLTEAGNPAVPAWWYMVWAEGNCVGTTSGLCHRLHAGGDVGLHAAPVRTFPCHYSRGPVWALPEIHCMPNDPANKPFRRARAQTTAELIAH